MRILALGLLPSILTSVYIGFKCTINRPGLSAKTVPSELLHLRRPDAGPYPDVPFRDHAPRSRWHRCGDRLFCLCSCRFHRHEETLKRLLGSSLNPKIGLHMIAAGLAGGAAFVLSQFIPIHGLIALIAYALLDPGVVRRHPLGGQGTDEAGRSLLPRCREHQRDAQLHLFGDGQETDTALGGRSDGPCSDGPHVIVRED